MSMIKKSISYTGGSERCNLCLEEKLSILKEKDNCLLNKRSELNRFGLPTQKQFSGKKPTQIQKGMHAILTTTLPP